VVAILPFALVLPGYALAAALFPGREIGRDERLVLVFGLSVAAVALGGLLVQVVLGLDRPVWAALLLLLTLRAVVAALAARDESRRDDQPSLSLPRSFPLSAAALLAALLIAGWAIGIATRGAHRQAEDAPLSSLSVVPQREGGTGPVSLGIWNQEGRENSYLLEVNRDGATLDGWQVRLAPGQQWQRRITASGIPGSGPLVVKLYRGGTLYRHVSLKVGATS
jgi:uncharacterized membrane protein